jgi:hypothetical protein
MGARVWPFSRKSFLDAEDETWQLETWACFLRHFGGIADLRLSPLVTPTSDFFPPTDATGDSRAQHVFDCVRHHSGMTDWPCKLIAQPVRPEARVSEFVFLTPVDKGLPLGTFGVSDNEVAITYDPGSLNDSVTLIATFAHELAHYRLAPLLEDLPGGEDMHEFATDLMTIYMGFGLFGANRAFNFTQHQSFMGQGWGWSRQGYLPERAWAFGLATFLHFRGESANDVRPYLKPHLYSDLRKAKRYLERRPLVSAEL